MPKTTYDRVKETSTTTGTGNFTLAGAVSQFVSFASRYADGEPFGYSIVGQTGSSWEVGFGYLSGGALVRAQVLQSSNSDALVNFGAGTKDVFVTIPADWVDNVPTVGQSIMQNRVSGFV
jgi:hypothetical protein